MSPSRPVGVFTTDLALVVRSWNAWLAMATGIPEVDAAGRPLVELFPDLEARGLVARLRRVADGGAVEVLAPAFHGYLIACPPREPSTHFTRMQQHVTIAPLLSGDAIVGTTVTIEDVTARRERERTLSRQLADGDEGARLQAARQLGADDPKAILAVPLAGALGDASWRVRRAAAEGLARAESGEAAEALLVAVRDRHKDPAVLNAALSALREAQRDVLPPLAGMLASPDADVRTYTALALGLLEDRRAVAPLVVAIDDPDANVRFHAIEALGRIGAREAADPLATVAESRDFAVAFAALDALALVGEPSVAPRLIPLLDDDFLQVAAAEALGHIGGEEVVAPLAALLARPEAPVGVVAGALATLHERLDQQQPGGGSPGGAGAAVADLARAVLTPDAARRLVQALGSARAEDRHGLVVVLGWLTDDGVEPAVAGMLGHPEVRRLAADILARRGPRAVAPLLDALVAARVAGDEEARKAAAAALGRTGAPGAVPALVALLDDVPEVAVVAAGALGHIGDRAAFEPLLAHLDHPQAAVRQGVVAALNSIGHPEMEARVHALLASPSARAREGAVKIAGYFGWAGCLDAMLGLLDDPDEAVRRTTVEQLAHLEDPRAAAAIAQALVAGVPGVRAAAARALAHVPASDALPLLERAGADPDPWVRYYAARAMGHHGRTVAVPALVALATRDPVPPVRIAAIEALAEIGDPGGLVALAPLASDADVEIAAPALLALGYGDDAATMAPIVAALAAEHRERRLAALGALVRRGGESAVAEVERLARTDDDADVRRAAIEVLARIGGAAAVAALVDLAGHPRRSATVVEVLAGLAEPQAAWVGDGLAHPDVDVRRAVIEALGRMRHAAAPRLLARALQDPVAAVRLAAAQALSRMDLREAEAGLGELARSDADPAVRRAAQRALIR